MGKEREYPQQIIERPPAPTPNRPRKKATDTQIGGDHYRNMRIQPVEYILSNELPFVEGCVVKYVSRWRDKGGIDDLRKARHFLDLLIEHEDELGKWVTHE